MRNMSVYCNVTSAFEMGDLDIIQEVITEDRVSQRHSGPSLPGPPPPPTDLLCGSGPGVGPQDQNHRILCPPPDQNHRIHGQTTSHASQPVLVARGTASRPSCSFPQRPSCTKEMASGHPNRGTSHLGPSRRGRSSGTSKSPEAPSSCTQNDTELLERILEKPDLVIVEQPKERGMRFRYECEGRSAGSILGASSTETTKTQPAIEIQGPIEHIKKVTVTASLVTKDIPYRPHPHCLVGKDCPEGAGICLVSFKPPERRHSFGNLGIQCVRRKELDASLEKRRSQNIDPFKTGHSKSIEDMDMNVVRLCFQCELEWEDGRKDSLSPVVSNPIYDKKATTTSQLKITCLNLYKGPCTGKTEIYMLCDKVQKDDIEIIFKRGTWEAKGEFAQTDVHRQIAIVFKSPPYQEQDITEEVEVNVVLRRLSDRMDSEAISFTYLPHNPDPYEVKRKRKIKTDISLTERPCVAAQSPATVEPSTSQLFHFPVPEQSMLAPEERLPPAAAVVVDNNYNALDNILSNQTFDGNNELNLINQLLEMPALQAMLSDPYLTTSMFHSFDQAPDASANFANFNPNLGPYPQDFSQYNDLTFSHLVSESQAQTENLPQDSPSNMLQVKIEEDQ